MLNSLAQFFPNETYPLSALAGDYNGSDLDILTLNGHYINDLIIKFNLIDINTNKIASFHKYNYGNNDGFFHGLSKDLF